MEKAEEASLFRSQMAHFSRHDVAAEVTTIPAVHEGESDEKSPRLVNLLLSRSTQLII